MPGITFSVPNEFAAISGQAELSDLDANFAAIVSALSGTVAALTDLPSAVNATGTRAWGKGADIASAATLNLGADGNYFDVTGTTTITAISSKQAGCIIVLQFDGALTLTHGAALILMGATNATTAAGDVYWFMSDGGGNWRELWRRPVTNAVVGRAFSGVGTWITTGGLVTNQGDFTVADSSTSDVTVAHGLGVAPKMVIFAMARNFESVAGGGYGAFGLATVVGDGTTTVQGSTFVNSAAAGDYGLDRRTIGTYSHSGGPHLKKFWVKTLDATNFVIGISLSGTGIAESFKWWAIG
jgi:hypothetical protein